MKAFSRVVVALTAAAATLIVPTTAFATVSAKGATVEAVNENGSPTALIDGGTVLSLKGTDFQAIKGGAGGVYVVFGWVSDPESMAWSPTNGGVTGDNYRYAPDAEDEGNKGFSRYVAFEGSKTAAAANGGFVAADGTWETELAIPTAVFESVDREGNPAEVDCLKDVCGVITIGAHAVKNANNETFTPITFVEDTSATEEPSEEPTQEPSQEPSATETSAEATESASPIPAESSPSTDGAETEAEAGINPVLAIVGGVAVIGVATAAVIAKSKRKTLDGK